MTEKHLGAQSATGVVSAGSIASYAATARHTPGPWRVVSDFVGPFRVVNEKDSTIAAAGYTNSSEAMANAELIAAAPELLEALKDCVSGLADMEPKLEARIHAAIAKAEGR